MPRSSLIWTAGITILAASSLAADYQQALILNDREDRARSRLEELDKLFIEALEAAAQDFRRGAAPARIFLLTGGRAGGRHNAGNVRQ